MQAPRKLSINLIVIFVALASLTGCQVVGSKQSGGTDVTGSVAVGSTSLNFGSVGVGTSKVLTDTITNFKTTSVTIASVSGLNPSYQITGVTFPFVLNVGDQVTFTVQFQPQSAGSTSTTLAFIGDAGETDGTVALSGLGVAPGQLSLNPTSLSFGGIQVGQSHTSSVILSNSGQSDISIDQAVLTGNGFTMGALTLPATLHAGDSTTLTVTFTPPSGGAFTGSISFSTSSPQANSQKLSKKSLAQGNGAGVVALPLQGSGTGQGTLTAAPTTLPFGTVQVNKSANLPETLTNTGSGTITISQANVTGAGFSISGLSLPATLGPNQTASFVATFSPTATGAATGSISVVSDAPNSPLDIALTGTGSTQGQVSPSPASLSFGKVQSGSSKTLPETLTNSGGSPVRITAATASGAGFSLSGLTLPLTLAAGQSTNFSVQFAPTTNGPASGSINITSNGSAPNVSIDLSGTGIIAGTLSANPSSLPFGSVEVGSTSTISETLTNTGGNPVIISQANLTGAAYSLSGLTLPVTVNPSQSVTFTVTFTPTAKGAANGTLAIVSDTSNSPLNLTLTGRGLLPGNLNPNPSTVNFGNVILNATKTTPVTVTNTGGTTVTLSSATLTGAGMSYNGLTFPLSLNANQSKTFNVVFSPTVAGNVSGTLTINSDASDPTTDIALVGVGVTNGHVTPNPTSIPFGNVTVGNSKNLSETLTNSGGTSLTITAATATGTGYSVTGLTLPVTLNAGDSTSFTVKFKPTAAGAVSGNLNIVSNGDNPSLDIALSGTGVTAGFLTANPTSLAFGNVQTTKTASLPETLTNTGGTSVTISQANVTGAAFSISGLTLPATVAPNQTVSFSATFAPTATGAASGTLAIVSDSSNSPLNIAMSGTGLAAGHLTANPTSLPFGNVQVGNNKTLSETLTNDGGMPVTISQANVTGTGYSITGLTLPKTLNAGQTVTFTAKFTPSGSGAVSGNLAIISDASNSTLNVGLTGTGFTPGTLSVSPTTLAFNTVTVGSSSAKTGTLTAAGNTVTVSAGSSNSGEFALSGISLPATIAAGASKTFTVTFTPSAVGSTSATLTFTSDASNSPTLETLTGTGQTPPSHSVDLTWNAVSGATGYNVYRKLSTGSSYSKINSSLNASTAYTDNGVSAGTTYDYVVTAVDASNAESGYSNVAEVAVPTP